MLTPEAAHAFADAWIAAWNAHDLDAIMSHYAADVEFTSPFVQRLLGDAAGTVRGTTALRDYFQRALVAYPDLTFRLDTVLIGIDTVTLYYESVDGRRAAEVMCLDDKGRVHRVLAHYAG